MTDTHPWPCPRRIAHGPHTIRITHPGTVTLLSCPGVPAHPDTMIGRQSPPVALSEVDALMDDLYTCHDPDCTATHVDMAALPPVTAVFTEYPDPASTTPETDLP